VSLKLARSFPRPISGARIHGGEVNGIYGMALYINFVWKTFYLQKLFSIVVFLAALIYLSRPGSWDRLKWQLCRQRRLCACNEQQPTSAISASWHTSTMARRRYPTACSPPTASSLQNSLARSATWTRAKTSRLAASPWRSTAPLTVNQWVLMCAVECDFAVLQGPADGTGRGRVPH
jgi:hypothetical protein